jgi:hypothetical protein
MQCVKLGKMLVFLKDGDFKMKCNRTGFCDNHKGVTDNCISFNDTDHKSCFSIPIDNPIQVNYKDQSKWLVGSFFADSMAMLSDDPNSTDPALMASWDDLNTTSV